MFGCELERYWGSRQFWRYFLVTGIGAGICITLVNFFSYQGSTLGASGAIYGVLLAYGMTFPDRIIYVMLFFPLPARIRRDGLRGHCLPVKLVRKRLRNIPCGSPGRHAGGLPLPEERPPSRPSGSKLVSTASRMPTWSTVFGEPGKSSKSTSTGKSANAATTTPSISRPSPVRLSLRPLYAQSLERRFRTRPGPSPERNRWCGSSPEGWGLSPLPGLAASHPGRRGCWNSRPD